MPRNSYVELSSCCGNWNLEILLNEAETTLPSHISDKAFGKTQKAVNKKTEMNIWKQPAKY